MNISMFYVKLLAIRCCAVIHFTSDARRIFTLARIRTLTFSHRKMSASECNNMFQNLSHWIFYFHDEYATQQHLRSLYSSQTTTKHATKKIHQYRKRIRRFGFSSYCFSLFFFYYSFTRYTIYAHRNVINCITCQNNNRMSYMLQWWIHQIKFVKSFTSDFVLEHTKKLHFMKWMEMEYIYVKYGYFRKILCVSNV